MLKRIPLLILSVSLLAAPTFAQTQNSTQDPIPHDPGYEPIEVVRAKAEISEVMKYLNTYISSETHGQLYGLLYKSMSLHQKAISRTSAVALRSLTKKQLTLFHWIATHAIVKPIWIDLGREHTQAWNESEARNLDRDRQSTIENIFTHFEETLALVSVDRSTAQENLLQSLFHYRAIRTSFAAIKEEIEFLDSIADRPWALKAHGLLLEEFENDPHNLGTFASVPNARRKWLSVIAQVAHETELYFFSRALALSRNEEKNEALIKTILNDIPLYKGRGFGPETLEEILKLQTVEEYATLKEKMLPQKKSFCVGLLKKFF